MYFKALSLQEWRRTKKKKRNRVFNSFHRRKGDKVKLVERRERQRERG